MRKHVHYMQQGKRLDDVCLSARRALAIGNRTKESRTNLRIDLCNQDHMYRVIVETPKRLSKCRNTSGTLTLCRAINHGLVIKPETRAGIVEIEPMHPLNKGTRNHFGDIYGRNLRLSFGAR